MRPLFFTGATDSFTERYFAKSRNARKLPTKPLFSESVVLSGQAPGADVPLLTH